MIHLMAYGKEMNDNIAYTLEMAKRMCPSLSCAMPAGKCVEKCPYHLPTPKRIQGVVRDAKREGVGVRVEGQKTKFSVDSLQVEQETIQDA